VTAFTAVGEVVSVGQATGLAMLFGAGLSILDLDRVDRHRPEGHRLCAARRSRRGGLLMPTSYNGWRASPRLSDLDTVRIEPVKGRTFIVRKVAAPLFAYLIRRFHAEVDPITGGVMDEWSYNYRKGRATNALSCHASATAVDLDATQFPMGRTNMTPKQVTAVRRILAATHKQFRWGGDFNRGYEDEMHFELVKGTTPSTVAASDSQDGPALRRPSPAPH